MNYSPTQQDAASLERKRAELADKLDRHAWRERRVVSGTASAATVDCVMRNRHLSRVLAGPRPVIGPRA